MKAELLAISIAFALGLPGLALSAPACDADNGGLALAEGFCAQVVASGLGPVRNLVVSPEGNVFAGLRSGRAGVISLHDADGDGRAERVQRFGESGGHSVLLTDTHLYFGENRRIVRWPWGPGQLEPKGALEIVVDALPRQGSHAEKGIAIDPDGALFVSIGGPSNACAQRRRAGSPGQDPCPQLVRQAGVWRFDANTLGQTQSPELRYATGMRHAMALAIQPRSGALFAAINGRDQLRYWGFDDEGNAELPAEEFVHVREGDDFGWPYCYFDGLAGRKVLAPEYGGDGKAQGLCASKAAPKVPFPAHWAPMAIAFYEGDQFPERYRGGAFVAFRGSWNRAPRPQEGYLIAFAPFANGAPRGSFETFASPEGEPTSIRFTGVALGPEGSLYVASESAGTVWRISHAAN